MDKVIDDYKANNFELNIKSKLYAINRGLDFDGFLDTRQALGAENLASIIKDLDEAGLRDWEIYGWYGDQRFGDDRNGLIKDGTPFFNESYFINEMKMDDLWMNMPCLKIRTGYHDGVCSPEVYLNVSMAPFERDSIMDMIPFSHVIIENERGGLFPGPGVSIRVINERYRRKVDDEYSVPIALTFRMPQTFCIKVRHDHGLVKDSWLFILPQDVDDMHERLWTMIRKEREKEE